MTTQIPPMMPQMMQPMMPQMPQMIQPMMTQMMQPMMPQMMQMMPQPMPVPSSNGNSLLNGVNIIKGLGLIVILGFFIFIIYKLFNMFGDLLGDVFKLAGQGLDLAGQGVGQAFNAVDKVGDTSVGRLVKGAISGTPDRAVKSLTQALNFKTYTDGKRFGNMLKDNLNTVSFGLVNKIGGLF